MRRGRKKGEVEREGGGEVSKREKGKVKTRHL